MKTLKKSTRHQRHPMNRFLMISVIVTLLLSGTVSSSILLGTSHASQTQVQSQPLPDQVPRPPTQSPQSSEVPTVPTPICNPKSLPLQFGSDGAKVMELQRALTQLGYGPLLGEGGVDGKFATSSENAVKKFQQDNRLPVDGKVGPITWGYTLQYYSYLIYC